MKPFTKSSIVLAALFLLCAAPLSVRAQSQQKAPAASSFYHLRFVVEEVGNDGKVVNARTYQTTVATDSGDQTIKAGSRVPVATGTYQSGGSATVSSLLNTQFQYIDLGVNIDVQSLHPTGNSIAFHIRATVSSMAGEGKKLGSVVEPVIRQNTWVSTVTVPLSKPTTVFSSDELDSKGKMQLQVTATRIE